MATRRAAFICIIFFICNISLSYAFVPVTIKALVGTPKSAGIRGAGRRKTTSFTLLSLAKGTNDGSNAKSLQKAYVSRSLSKILGEQKPPGNGKEFATQFSLRSLFHRLVQTIIVRPGVVVGRWVLSKSDRSPAIPAERNTRGKPAKEIDVGVNLADQSTVAGVARKHVTPSDTDLQKPSSILPKTERVFTLIDRYSARRPDESPGQNSRPQLDERLKPVRTESQDRDRRTLLLDSYAKRHKEGEELANRGYVSNSREGVKRKPILRSQYADLGEDSLEKDPRAGKVGKETKRVTKESQKKQEESRLELLINRYADRAATRENSGQPIPIVRKNVNQELKRSSETQDKVEEEKGQTEEEKRKQQDLRASDPVRDTKVDDVID